MAFMVGLPVFPFFDGCSWFVDGLLMIFADGLLMCFLFFPSCLIFFDCLLMAVGGLSVVLQSFLV